MAVLSPFFVSPETIHQELEELRPYVHCFTSPGQTAAEGWEECLPHLTPRQLALSLPPDMGLDALSMPHIDISFCDGNNVTRTTAIIEVTARDAYKLRLQVRQASAFTGGHIKLENCFVDTWAEDQSYAKKLLHWVGKLAQTLEKPNLHTFATDDNGGYTWAKFGFVPDDAAWEEVQGRLKEMVQDGRATLSAATHNTYAHLLPDSFTLTRHERGTIEEAVHSHDAKHIWLVSDLGREVARIDKGPDKPPLVITVGKALLCGQEWMGELSLEPGSPGYDRFTSYISRAPNPAVSAMGTGR